MSCFQVRTDLALEAREGIKESKDGIRGVRVEETYNEKSEIKVTKVVIESKNGAKAMGKPMGVYVTLEWWSRKKITIRKYLRNWQSN